MSDDVTEPVAPEPEPVVEPVSEPTPEPTPEPTIVPEGGFETLPEPFAEPVVEASEYPPLLPDARSHLDVQPGDHSIPERRRVGNSDAFEMTGNRLYFDGGGARLQ